MEKLNNWKKFNEKIQIGDFSLFIDKPNLQYYLSPGPMKISNTHKHEEYSFNIKKKEGVYYFNILNDEDINRKRIDRQKLRDGISKGNVVWFEPGGYHVGVKFKEVNNNTQVQVIGRPSNAVGKSPLIKEYMLKGWNTNVQEKEMKKYTLEYVRKLLFDVDGTRITFV